MRATRSGSSLSRPRRDAEQAELARTASISQKRLHGRDAVLASGGVATLHKYTAPALEKGLDVLELLSRVREPQTFPAIVQQLDRSTGELFRMVQVLERRGYIAQTDGAYSLTSRLLEMGIGGPPVSGLIEVALPTMRELAIQTRQSCHLAFASRGEIVVVARMEAHEQLGYSVRVGYRQSLHLTGSGAALYAYQRDEVRRAWEELLSPPPNEQALKAFRSLAEEVKVKGIASRPSGFTEGVTDLSVPILRGEIAAAALAIPFIKRVGDAPSIEAVADALRAASARISAALPASDSRA